MTVDETRRPDLPKRRTDEGMGPMHRSDLSDIQDLKPFADQLMAIAEQLRDGEFLRPPNQASSTSQGSDEPTEAQDTGDGRRKYAQRARAIYATRRRRDAIFGKPELFGEPAWDILLDLYVAYVDEKPVSVSSACIGSAAPPTTGLRWLGVLADEGLVVREQDPADQRRVLVRLTERGVDAMDEYLASAGTAP